jgi:endo-1,4-beta-xylanase
MKMKNKLKYFLITALAVTLAVLFTACAENFIFPERPLAEESIIIPVEHITGIPIGSRPGLEITLSGIVTPENATNKRIVWSLTGAGAGATLVRNKLSTTGEGNVTVTATIKDGLGTDEDYTQNFNIVISVTMIAVASVEGIPSSVTVGDYTLIGKVAPTNALNKTIVWSVKDAGTTGAEIDGSTLTTTSPGIASITATIANGKLNGDYTQDFTVVVY